ncbi:MAG: sigma-70 family RNA polymerase sigma factor [Lentisphaerales bacterium]|nr:sigma-70 family RNA polymerase sigma factor [Lentisphaerales bacterium]
MDKNDNTRETLLIKLKNQYNENAWEEFAEIYRGFIWSILIKMNVSPSDIDDLVQDILLKAWKNLPKFDYQRSRGKFRNWLGLVVSNTARTYFRNKNTTSRILGSLDTEDQMSPEIEKLTTDEWQKFISNKAWESVSKTLTDPVRECFELISQGMNLKEVGEKTGFNYNTVCVYKKRIINKISREITRLENETG